MGAAKFAKKNANDREPQTTTKQQRTALNQNFQKTATKKLKKKLENSLALDKSFSWLASTLSFFNWGTFAVSSTSIFRGGSMFFRE
jgi:hypothetical protein